MFYPFLRPSVLVVCVTVLLLSAVAHAQPICPPLDSRHGNRDYLDPAQRGALGNVERVHFNENVRLLRGGARGSGSTLRGDLEYTLNWFPNHHIALDTLIRLVQREGTPEPLGAVNIECRFEWARAVNPRDGMVPMLEAQYRLAHGDEDQAKKLLEEAARIGARDANVRYNVALLYYRLEDFEQAVRNGREAYRLGFPLPGLRNLLEQAGHPL